MAGTEPLDPGQGGLPPDPDEFAVPGAEREFGEPDPAGEFSPPSGTDYPPPPPEREFTPPGAGGESPPDAGRRKRRLRMALYAAAAVLLLNTYAGRQAPVIPSEVPSVTARPGGESSPAPSAAPAAPSDAPSPTPSATPEPTPEPTPAEPGCELVFFDFSSAYYGRLQMICPERIEAVRAELWESNLDTLEWSCDLTPQEIAAGVWELPEFDASETYFNHLASYRADDSEPALELRVTLAVSGGEELTYTARPSYEQGWSVRYWPEDFKPLWDGQEYYPGCFAVASYEAHDAPPAMAMGGREDAQAQGGIWVSLEIDGVSVSARTARIVTREEPYESASGGGVFYYTTVVIPRPAEAPLSGTAHFTVYQRLEGYDTVWTSERELQYGP